MNRIIVVFRKGIICNKLIRLFLITSLLILVPMSWAYSDEPIKFPDENLEQAVRDAIDKQTGDIYPSDLDGLNALSAWNSDISDLTGIEHCQDLNSLGLSNNNVSNLSPLSGLTSLELLNISGNPVSDLTPLYGLSKLKRLYANSLKNITDLDFAQNLTSLKILSSRRNRINSIEPLGGLRDLERLKLSDNEITDIEEISTIGQLEVLTLDKNMVSNLEPISELEKLDRLKLGWNEVKDISPLVANNGIDDEDYIGLTNNFLALYQGSKDLENIRKLQARGVNVNYKPQHINAVNIADDNLERVIREKIDKPTGQLIESDLEPIKEIHAQDEDITYLAGIENCENLTRVYLQGNNISNIYPLKSLHLYEIHLSDNKIYSIKALVENNTLGAGKRLYIKNNYLDLSDGSADLNQIRILQDRGVEITYQPQKEPPEITSSEIHVPEDFTSIQVAVDAASKGDDIVISEGIYSENIDVSTPNVTIRSIQSSDNPVVQALDKDDHVFDVSVDNVTFEGLSVKGASGDHKAGILLRSVEGVDINSSRFSNNYYGVQLLNSSNSVISGCSAVNNKHNGINLYNNSRENFIEECEIYGSTDTGIDFSKGSNHNTVKDCKIHGVEEDGIYFYKVKHNEVLDTEIYDCPLFGILFGNLELDSPAEIEHNAVRNSAIHDCFRGVNMWRGASQNIIEGSEIYNNEDQAVNLEEESVSENEILDCELHDNMQGVRINHANRNLVKGNNVFNNDQTAIGLESQATDNEVVKNSISDNNNGIFVDDASGNVIYLNRFTQNKYSVGTDGSTSKNRWYSEQKIEYKHKGETFENYTGNYWSEYSGTDEDGDGIGEQPYSVINEEKDPYPMIGDPWTGAVFRVTKKGDVRSDAKFYGEDFVSEGADLAEKVKVTEQVEPGDVLSLDPTNPRHYQKSQKPYSTFAAGVVSTQPGMTLGNKDKTPKATIALKGTVPVKATTENGPIQSGNLLTTASKAGYAMACNDRDKCSGAIIGKALETLKEGEGKVRMLVVN